MYKMKLLFEMVLIEIKQKCDRSSNFVLCIKQVLVGMNEASNAKSDTNGLSAKKLWRETRAKKPIC